MEFEDRIFNSAVRTRAGPSLRTCTGFPCSGKETPPLSAISPVLYQVEHHCRADKLRCECGRRSVHMWLAADAVPSLFSNVPYLRCSASDDSDCPGRQSADNVL